MRLVYFVNIKFLVQHLVQKTIENLKKLDISIILLNNWMPPVEIFILV